MKFVKMCIRDRCKELSLYDTGVSVEYGDKLITLSTCEYSRTNGRLVVVAKKVTAVSSTHLDRSQAAEEIQEAEREVSEMDQLKEHPQIVELLDTLDTVSYTHLDVYKRQSLTISKMKKAKRKPFSTKKRRQSHRQSRNS